jgi:hypothetical protein
MSLTRSQVLRWVCRKAFCLSPLNQAGGTLQQNEAVKLPFCPCCNQWAVVYDLCCQLMFFITALSQQLTCTRSACWIRQHHGHCCAPDVPGCVLPGGYRCSCLPVASQPRVRARRPLINLLPI